MPLAFRRCFLTLMAAVLAVGALAADATKTVTIEDLTLTIPDGWTRDEPSNKLRLAQFSIPNAPGETQPTEMVVSYFGGGAGGVDANIERWITQFDRDGRQVKVVKGQSSQGVYYLADISGTYQMSVGPPFLRKTEALPDARMLAVILSVKEQGNYFLKLAGPSKTVTAQADALRASFGGDAKTEGAYELK